MNNFIPLTSKKYKRKGFKYLIRHFVKCGYCERLIKSMNYHLNKYHKEEINNINKAIGKGYIGNINGIRFVQSG